MKRILANVAFAAILLAGCSSNTSAPVIPTSSGQMPPVAILRLYDSTGNDISPHIQLDSGRTHRIEVRLLAADGTTRITGGVKVALSFDPPSYAQALPTDTLHWGLTPTAPVGTFGSLSITLTALATPLASGATSQTFGPFQVLVHPMPL